MAQKRTGRNARRLAMHEGLLQTIFLYSATSGAMTWGICTRRAGKHYTARYELRTSWILPDFAKVKLWNTV